MKRLAERVKQLKKERKVVLGARFFVSKKEKDIADSVGDSCCMGAFPRKGRFPKLREPAFGAEDAMELTAPVPGRRRDSASDRSVYEFVQ